MSLNNLATELHGEIAGHLSPQDLSSLSRETKYYQEVSEKFLYEEIDFVLDGQTSKQIRKLMSALIKRHELALDIKSFKLGDPKLKENYLDQVPTNSPANRCWDHLSLDSV